MKAENKALLDQFRNQWKTLRHPGFMGGLLYEHRVELLRIAKEEFDSKSAYCLTCAEDVPNLVRYVYTQEEKLDLATVLQEFDIQKNDEAKAWEFIPADGSELPIQIPFELETTREPVQTIERAASIFFHDILRAKIAAQYEAERLEKLEELNRLQDDLFPENQAGRLQENIQAPTTAIDVAEKLLQDTIGIIDSVIGPDAGSDVKPKGEASPEPTTAPKAPAVKKTKSSPKTGDKNEN